MKKIVPVGPVYAVIESAALNLPLESYRVIQESLERVVIQAVKQEGYLPKHTDFLINYMHQYLGEDVNIEMEFVEDIPSLPSGKRSPFISKINPFD